MNKSILFTILIFVSLGFLMSFANAQATLDKELCKCKSVAHVKCGFGKSDEAVKCRSSYIKKCETRYNVIVKCSNQIGEKCISFKKGTSEYKKCERSTAAKYCVSTLDTTDLHNCKCKSFSRALCGSCPSPTGVHCRDDAYEACKQQCKDKAPCKGKKRICITPPHCSCKSIAKKKCSVAANPKACCKIEYSTCKKRCIAATRCYPLTCKNAGHKRCAEAVTTVCEKFSSDLKQYEQCVVKKTERCHAYELSNCKKARRLFKYRSECDYTAKVKCEGIKEEGVAICKSQVRQKCIQTKIVLRKKYIRHTSTCTKRAKLICDQKQNCQDLRACYIEETKHCIRRKHRREYIVPEECVERVVNFCGSKKGACYKENIGKCTEIWLRRYCERKAYKECDCDLACMREQVRKCTPPKCWRNRQLCNDNNKCTNDVCDPKIGCLHIPKTCDDVNLCTNDICDPKQGCVHTPVNCDDKVDCTIDKCNTKNGQCKHTSDNTKCTTTDKCTLGHCTSSGCKFHKSKEGQCFEKPPSCDCPAKSCETVSCELQDDLKPKCTYKDKNCDDGKKCTRDYCDISSGKCVHVQITNTAVCPSTTKLCTDTLDCSDWGISQDLTCKCSVASCDVKLGVCVAIPATDTTCVECDKCQKYCTPRDACDEPTTSCSRDASGKIICNRLTTSCNDGSICTQDTCNVNTGKCEYTYVKNEICLEKCITDLDCIIWAVESELHKECKTAQCDQVKKTCVIIDQLDERYCPKPPTICQKCKPINACETAECFLDSNNQPACRRSIKTCDDLSICTVDSCDTETGECVHKFVENQLCKECKINSDCDNLAKTLNLAPICKTAKCENRVCVISTLTTCPTPQCTQCTPANKCEAVECTHDSQGAPTCARSSRICNDFDDCTTDSCDGVTGVCVFTLIDSPKCQKCQFDSDCTSWGNDKKLSDVCREPYCNGKGHCRDRPSQDQSRCKTPLKCINCVPLTPCDQVICIVKDGTPTCEHSQVNCQDADKCTQDYCDIYSGNCVHNKIYSKECKQCKAQVDCDQWGKDNKLADHCLEPYCEDDYCRVRPTKDQTKCIPAICPDCNSTVCETAQCVFGDDNQPTCIRTKKSCDDGNKCTVDSCDSITRQCIHTAYQTSQCVVCNTATDCVQYGIDHQLDSNCKIPICNTQGLCDSQNAPDTTKCNQNKCSVDTDCILWATTNKIADQCLTAYCDAGKCQSRPINDLTKCKPPVCQTCTPANSCETADCVLTNNKYICDRKPKNCDDGIDCTADSCDLTSGQCVHTTNKCTLCNLDQDCSAYAVAQKLNKCQRAICEPNLKICVTQVVPDKTCVPQYFCDLQCPPKDNCYVSQCHYDDKKNVICDTQTLKVCNDNNDCTADSCDVQKGCSNVFKASNKCFKCTKDTDCVTYAINNNLNSLCLVGSCSDQGQCISKPNSNPACVPQQVCDKSCATNNKCQSYGCQYDAQKNVKCTYVVNTCNDGKDCTLDSCDTTTGLCVHQQKPDCGPFCKTTLDCTKWGIDNKLADNCKQPFCDQTQGACVAVDVPDVTKCPVPNCNTVCPGTKCQTFTCAYNVNKKVICTPKNVDCNDNNDCTTDSCDINSGCVHTFIDSATCIQCTKDDQCSTWAQKLGACFTVSCDTTLNKCVKKAVSSPTCNNPPPPCPITCQPSNKCQTATLVKTSDTCTCQVTPISCDDGIDCTVDSCDATTGKCKFVFTPSFPKCTVQCQVVAQCGKYAIDNNLSAHCQIPYCDTKLGSCQAKDDDQTNCKKCQLDCKPSSNCDDAKCVWIGNTYQCQHNPKNCDDGKTCTTDSCDLKTGNCVHKYQCPTPQCNSNVDCASWGVAQNFASQCLIPVCNTAQGSCQSVPNPSCSPLCKQSSDCPPTQFGSVCDQNTCVPNQCQFDADCLTTNTNPNTWSYCKVCNPTAGQKCCSPLPKCVVDKNCDDQNPCTSDICLPEYGFCRNIARCDDHNACTTDIATPSADGKSCTCSNPPIPCTTDATLLNANFVLLSNADKAKWLGKCDKNKGCVSCVVNAQCDDHNGCSTDSCAQQYCISVPINNAWCDPVLASQPIYFQSIPGLRTQLELAGYDIAKLAT